MISAICPLGLSDDELSRWYDDDLPAARMEMIRAHRATCSACRERLAAFAEIGAGLRNLTPPPLDLARLLAGLPAMAPVSDLADARPWTPRPVPRRSWRMVTGAAGLAAVVILSLFAGYLFLNHGRTRPGAVATATAKATPSPLFSLGEFPLHPTVIAMSSATEGWAFANTGTQGSITVIALRYTGGKWARVTTPMQGQINALTMISATDGWAVGDYIYHYDGSRWREVTTPWQEQNERYMAVAATAPSSVWISAFSATPGVLHYDGTTWMRQPLPTPESLGFGKYYIAGFAMASADEGWAVTGGETQGPTLPGVLLRYTRGVWNADRACSDCDLSAISLANASDGWVGGGYSAQHNDKSVSVKPLLWRLSNGAWKDASLPAPSTTDTGDGSTDTSSIQTIHLFSATEGWLVVATTPQHALYHLENGQWTPVPMTTHPNPFNAGAFAFVSPDEFWAIGEYGISHYRNGAWTNVGSPAMP